jgi:expansin (peptidoglycan-binding protein)
MTTVEKTSAIRSLAQSLADAGGLKYASMAAYWQVQTPQGKLSLYDVALAAGFSKADVQAASDKRQTKTAATTTVSL